MVEPFTHSSGFGGLCAVIAALVAAAGIARTVRQRERSERRDQWWQRFAWLNDHTSRINNHLALRLLDQLTASARALRDDDLVAFAQERAREVYGEVRASTLPTPQLGPHTEDDEPQEGAR
jgi:hypothetical protein